MIFGVVLRVIGSKVEGKCFLAVFGQKPWTNPLGFWSKFKFAKTFCIGKRSREMMFGVVLRAIGSKVEGTCFLAVLGQKPWTNPLGFWSKFQIC